MTPLEPIRRVALMVPADGIVQSVAVPVGATVREGQEVVQLDRAAAAARLKIAQAGVKEVQAALKDLMVQSRAAETLKSTVEVADLHEKLIGRPRPGPTSAQVRPRPTLEDMTCEYVLRVLGQSKGNKSEAARILGVPRRTLYRMLERYAEAGKLSDVRHVGPSVH